MFLYITAIIIVILAYLTFFKKSASDPTDYSEGELYHHKIIPQIMQRKFVPTTVEMTTGRVYIPLYSEVYVGTVANTIDMSVMVSMRNVNMIDSIQITRAEYFNSQGHKVRSYVADALLVGPMETREIVIDETDFEGGPGAKFIFEWSGPKDTNEPLFEGIMISTNQNQGLSFITRGIEVF